MHSGHRKRMRGKFLAGNFLPDHERLELLLTFSVPRKNTNDVAHRLLAQFGTLEGVFEAEYEQLLTVRGLGEKSALMIRLIAGMRERSEAPESDCGLYLDSVGKLGDYATALFQGSQNECIYAALLSSSMRLVDCVCLSGGNYANAEVDFTALTTSPWLFRSSSVVLLHNHPEGDLAASDEDREFAAKVSELLSMTGIQLLEHIIVCGDRFAPTMRDVKLN